MNALDLTTGTDDASRRAIDRIRSELGEAVAARVVGESPTVPSMTLRAMKLVQEMLNDTSTFLYSQGREHILQQAMEDGSSIICSNCGDMISRERWKQHAEYWCRELKLSDSNDDGDCVET